MWCRRVQRDLTALVDGELAAWRSKLVRRHLDGCPTCREELAAVERAVLRQRELLPLLDDAGPIPIDAMLRRVRQGVQQQDPEPVRRRSWLIPPVIAAATAGGVLVFGLLRWSVPILVTVGLEEPPEVVAEKPDLFRDYTLFENFDTIEHLERGSTAPAESRG